MTVASPSDGLPRLSFIFPVFRSELNIPPLLTALDAFAREHAGEFELECVFVVDGSPDDARGVLLAMLPQHDAFVSQVHDLSRNFGAPFAVRCGLERASGDYFAPVAVDLQEPFESIHEMFLQVRKTWPTCASGSGSAVRIRGSRSNSAGCTGRCTVA